VIIVCGAGPHGREIGEIIRDLDSEPLYLDDNPKVAVQPVKRVAQIDAEYVLGPAWPLVRRAVACKVQDALEQAVYEFDAAVLVHPDATVTRSADLAGGVVIAPGVRIMTDVSIGWHTHINVNATVSHSCVVGDFVTICPGVHISGEVSIGDDVFVGVGAVVKNGVSIGDGALIGAGAVVLSDVAAGTVVAGNPARVLV
jgi:sugar O-acyltransferase (sialic acid O-acetyltransferase NeuD family)